MVLKAVAVEKTSYIQAEIPAPIYPVVLYAANLSLISFFFCDAHCSLSCFLSPLLLSEIGQSI